jgi:hypothetical protein
VSVRRGVRGVALLERCLAIGIEDLLDDGEKRAKDGLGSWRRDVEGGGLRLADDLADSLEVEVIFGASFLRCPAHL